MNLFAVVSNVTSVKITATIDNAATTVALPKEIDVPETVPTTAVGVLVVFVKL